MQARFALILVWLLAEVIANDSTQWLEYAKQAKNSTRDIWVQQTLKKASGVYKDKEKGKSMGLQKTVFSTVIAYGHDEIFHYKVYFRNFLCFARHHNIDVVVYILHHGLKNVEQEVSSMTDNLGLHVLTYPDELFWKIVGTKKNRIIRGKSRANYDGTVPNFHGFGALPMLVPLLEMLEYGYNAIYFDVDIGLVQDPVPYLIRGDADFVSTVEVRECPEVYPSRYPLTMQWNITEPNTGVMHVRATKQGIQLYRTWLENIVDENLVNDQKAFDRNNPLFHAQYTGNCNWNMSYPVTTRVSPQSATYCFLSEILFQNGKVGISCTQPGKHGSRNDWIVEMWHYGTSDMLADKRFPVIVHANYCNGKSHELGVRGLWLIDDDHKALNLTCKPYNINSTYYATLDWRAEYTDINNTRNAFHQQVRVNQTLVKRLSGNEVYLIEVRESSGGVSVVKRQIPDKDTFEKLGFDWGNVKTVPSVVLESVALGPPLPSLK